jgi:hypothetical protein
MAKKTQMDKGTGTPVKGELVTVDMKLVDAAVDWIKSTALAGIKKTLVDVGEYIVANFFRGDIELAKSKSPTKNASYQALVDRCGSAAFPVSKAWLNTAVGVALMRRQIPSKSAFNELAPSLQQTLLPLRDPDQVEKLAKKVIEGEYTVRKTREVVAQELAKRAEDEPRGRPPTPTIMKTLNRSLKLFTFEDGKRSFTRADVKQLDDEQKTDAVKSARALIDKLQGLVDKLEKLSLAA